MERVFSTGRFLLIVVCVMHVGCDGVVGSAKRLDACGVCGGSNNTCRLVSGLFTRPQLPEGYSLIAQIPRGACNVSVSELKPSRNYLALKQVDGTYVINGNWAINWSGEYEAVGTRFSYRRQDASSGERIAAPGPLTEPVDIMVIYQQPNPGIKYEYMLPMVPPAVNSVKDDISVKGGPVFDGIETRSRPDNPVYPYGSGVLGTESQGRVHHPGHQNAAPVGDEAHKPQPRTRGRKRKFLWKFAGYTECSKTCGGGVQTPVAVCVREHNQQTVPDKRCAYQDRPHPQPVRCNAKPCPAEWVPGDWSDCSVTCGEGAQTRDMMCKQEITATLTMKVAEGACLTPPTLPRTQKCILPPCSGVPVPGAQAQPPVMLPQQPQWEVGPWGQCSAKCGQGTRSRSVKCMGPSGDVDECPQADRPSEETVCDMGSCSEHSEWFYTDWTQQCSEECGTGVQTRKVFCLAGMGADLCDEASRPDDSRACSSDKQCSGKWFIGPWGQCSSACGEGRQTRDVACVAFLRGQHRVVLDMNCPAGLKPDTERACEGKPCGPKWFFTDWSQCSRECGTGLQRREVRCLDENQEPSVNCPEDLKPPNRRVCNAHECSSNHASVQGSEAERVPKYLPHSKIDDDPSLANGAGDQALPPPLEETAPHKGGECVDKFRNCHLVVQARLCRYKYYGNSCCQSCHKKS